MAKVLDVVGLWGTFPDPVPEATPEGALPDGGVLRETGRLRVLVGSTTVELSRVVNLRLARVLYAETGTLLVELLLRVTVMTGGGLLTTAEVGTWT